MEATIEKKNGILSISIPDKMINELNLKEGDRVTLDINKGGIEITDTEFSEWAEAYRKMDKKYEDVLRELSK